MEESRVRNNKERYQACSVCLIVLLVASPNLCRDYGKEVGFFVQCAPDSAKPSPKESLEIVVEQFVAALRERDEGALTQQFSKDGVAFGIDSDTMPLTAIRKRMRKNEELYCLFFDTQCLRRDPSFQKQSSLRDSLVNGKGHHSQVAINQQSQPMTGEVRLFVEGNPDRARTGEEFCNLTYKLEDNAWKIQEVLFY
jgi:hypothetical protein